MTFTIIPGLQAVASDYDAFILDLWGVVHNGKQPYPGALDCMARLREGGRQIILVSNAPRTNNFVISFLEGLGVARDRYDHILTSGDLTRQALETRDHPFLKDRGKAFYQIGASRDKGLEDGLEYARVFDVPAADFLICTGLTNDETETPEDYRNLLSKALSHDLPMLCANPDLTVMRGDASIYCAGAIAALYAEMGGRVVLFGKPYPEVYRQAMARLAISDPARILAVGDSMRTDIKGAASAGIDSILVSGGIHADEWGLQGGALPSAAQVASVVGEYAFSPRYVTGHMIW
ncbi:MAG: TIGR01459 family HAD-type hydrolase [Sneathiella sp.]|jgi:HAD superfamily hydrolase (TIGR01459 family)|uniref:TIGR01459 family HAD-type hydrolase n=1 Tax=Sneathiella sp. TaxID=1964365 RepID=UPI000C3EE689|nr:TIGR01459 family HAD-type hydrolase [Sneathiella sp.]MAL78668.1 TIGR01459 family HAD-type hydrolase [Sneathiella sp.]